MYYLRKFFYYTFGRPKSALAVIFLLFIFGGIILPNTAMAAWWEQLIPGWSTWATVRDIGALAGIDVGGVVGGIAADLFAEVLRALSYVWLVIWYALADIVSKLADFIIRELLGKSITGNSAESAVFLTLWAVVRDWANMLIVIGLIGVAIATILSLEKYKAQKLLLPIIIVALLVNFSVLFVGLVIDASNIIMRDMTRGINTNTMVNGAWRVRNNAVSSIEGSNLDSAQKNLRVAIANAAFGWMFILLGASFGFLVLIFLQRYAILAILFIFSPLAFVLYVFPVDKAQELFKEWWQKFIKWSFAGLGAAFCLRLAMDMLNVLGAGQADSLDAMFYQFAIVLVILVVGLKISVKQSGPLAQAVIGIAKTAGVVVAGAVTGGIGGYISGQGIISGAAKGGYQGKPIAQNLSNEIGSWAKHRLAQVGEGVGILNKGTAATIRQRWGEEQLKQPMERLKNLGSEDLAHQAVNGPSARDRAAATQILKERNKLRLIPKTQRRVAMENLMAHDNKLTSNDFSKSDYRYTAYDKKITDRIKDANPTLTQPEVEEVAMQEQLENNFSSMSPEERRSIDKKHIPKLMVSRAMNAGAVRNYGTADIDTIEAVRKSVTTPGGINDAIAQAEEQGLKQEVARLRNIKLEISRLPGARARMLSGIDNPELISDIGNIPSGEIGEVIDKATPEQRRNLQATYGTRKIDMLEIPTKRLMTREEIDQANMLNISDLRTRQLMISDDQLQMQNQERVENGLEPITLSQAYEEAREKARNQGEPIRPIYKEGDQVEKTAQEIEEEEKKLFVQGQTPQRRALSIRIRKLREKLEQKKATPEERQELNSLREFLSNVRKLREVTEKEAGELPLKETSTEASDIILEETPTFSDADFQELQGLIKKKEEGQLAMKDEIMRFNELMKTFRDHLAVSDLEQPPTLTEADYNDFMTLLSIGRGVRTTNQRIRLQELRKLVKNYFATAGMETSDEETDRLVKSIEEVAALAGKPAFEEAGSTLAKSLPLKRRNKKI